MISIKVPPLGESITEATISRWLKKEGDAVAIGDTLVELETDKITVEVPALNAGTLSRRLKAEGDVVQLAEILAELNETDVGAPASAPAPASANVRAAPSAIRLANESGVDLSKVEGTGRGGVVSKPDLIDYMEGRASSAPSVPASPTAGTAAPASPTAGTADPASPIAGTAAPASPIAGTAAPASPIAGTAAPASPIAGTAAPASPIASPAALAKQPPARPASNSERETREKMTTRRKRIAENLLQAQHSTAHLTTFNEIDMTAVSSFRERMKERVEKEHGVKLSFMPFFAKATCLALKAFPIVNAQLDGDSIIYKHYVNLGIAVASEAGLVVPNIKDADRMGMLGFSRAIVSVAKRARDSKLTMDDLTGGTFTITNGGVFGSLLSTPIINYPQVAILGLHKTQDRPIALNGEVVIRSMMYVALSYDHRIIDGQQAVLFLVKLKELMEDPASMLIDD